MQFQNIPGLPTTVRFESAINNMIRHPGLFAARLFKLGGFGLSANNNLQRNKIGGNAVVAAPPT